MPGSGDDAGPFARRRAAAGPQSLLFSLFAGNSRGDWFVHDWLHHQRGAMSARSCIQNSSLDLAVQQTNQTVELIA